MKSYPLGCTHIWSGNNCERNFSMDEFGDDVRMFINFGIIETFVLMLKYMQFSGMQN